MATYKFLPKIQISLDDKEWALYEQQGALQAANEMNILLSGLLENAWQKMADQVNYSEIYSKIESDFYALQLKHKDVGAIDKESMMVFYKITDNFFDREMVSKIENKKVFSKKNTMN